jgi:hypothetical protein
MKVQAVMLIVTLFLPTHVINFEVAAWPIVVIK